MLDFINVSFLKVSWLFKWVTKLAYPLVDNSIGVDQLSEFQEILSIDGKYAGLWSVVNSAINIVVPFGLALITTYFLMYLFEAASKDQITADSLIKVLIQLIIVVALVTNLAEVINAMLSLGESIFKLISNAIVGTGESGTKAAALTGKDIVDKWAEEGEDAAGTILFQSILLWVIHQIAKIAVYFAIFSRMIELGWRIIFAPVGIANSFEGGANSAGIRYLKGIAAVAISGAAIFVVCAVGFSVSATMLDPTAFANNQTSIFAAMGAQLATAGAAIGVGNKVKEIVQ